MATAVVTSTGAGGGSTATWKGTLGVEALLGLRSVGSTVYERKSLAVEITESVSETDVVGDCGGRSTVASSQGLNGISATCSLKSESSGS